jgi:hypothetical protein
MMWRPSSMTALDKPWDGRHHVRHWMRRCDDPLRPRRVGARSLGRGLGVAVGAAMPSMPRTNGRPTLARSRLTWRAPFAAEAGVHAERWRCIKKRPRRCLRGRGRDCHIARRAHDNRAPSRRSGRHVVPGSAVSVLRSWHAFPPLAFFASLHRRAVGLAGDTSSEFLHPRFRGQEVLREPGRFTDPAMPSA